MDKLTIILGLGMAGIIPLYAVILSSNSVALILILTFALMPGLTEQVVGIPSQVSRAALEICVLMLFTKALCLQLKKPGKPFRAVGFLPMIAFFFVSLLSFLLSEESYIEFLLFLRYTFVFYLFFLALLNLNLSAETIKTINSYLIVVFAFQIVPALIKFSQVGIKEGGGIGTVSVHAGEFSTTLPLFAISFLLAFYYWRRDLKYLLWVPVFIAFGILGGKRGLVFYLPPLLLFTYIFFLYGRQGGKLLATAIDRRRPKKILITIILISFGTMYASFRILGALNPEQTIGGSFDPVFAFEEMLSYQSNVMEEGGYFEAGQTEAHTGPALATGRISSTLMSFRRLAGEGPVALLLGSGAGLLVGSPLAQQDLFETFRSIGIRYGFTGLVWLVNQVGILGVLLFLLFYGQMFRKGLAVYRKVPGAYWKSIALGFLGASFVFLLDFLTYSVSTLTMGSLSPPYYYVAAICFSRLYGNASGSTPAAGSPA